MDYELRMKILDYVKQHYHNFEWCALVRLLRKLPNVSLYFRSSHSLGFAAREIERVDSISDHEVLLSANFLGLQGAATPLPLHFAEFIVQDDPDESNLNDFFNFFNQQFYCALMHVDAKYSYLEQRQPCFQDFLSQGLLNLAGVVPHERSQLLSAKLFLGLRYFVGGAVSKQGLCGYLQQIFGFNKVQLRECVAKEIAIPAAAQTALVKQNTALGLTSVLGARMLSRALHMELHVFVERVEILLPETSAFLSLRELLQYLLPAPLWVTLVVHARQVPLLVLNAYDSLRLGYDSVLNSTSQYEYFVRLSIV